MKAFDEERKARIASNGSNADLRKAADSFMRRSMGAQYSYNFRWLGRPIIQYPQDILAMQEIIWNVKPDLIIETGIAHGGSLIFSASMLELNAACGGPAHAKVLAVDIDIRSHNRSAIEAHPLSPRIEMIQGSSIDPAVIDQIRLRGADFERVLVCLDSNHTHNHVLEELNAYAPMTSKGSYCVVFDTIVEHMPMDMFDDRPWGPGDNPKTAVQSYLATHPEFEVDAEIDSQLMISVAPGGFLKKIR